MRSRNRVKSSFGVFRRPLGIGLWSRFLAGLLGFRLNVGIRTFIDRWRDMKCLLRRFGFGFILRIFLFLVDIEQSKFLYRRFDFYLRVFKDFNNNWNV